MSKQKLHKISVNNKLIDKFPPENANHRAHEFISEELTLDEIAEVVSLGFAISYQFIDGHRKTENFLATDILAIDVDGGMTLEECLKHKIVTKYGSLIYTTPSHSIDRNRFRILFSLPRTIKDKSELKFAVKSLARRLGGDLSATDAARMFYGSRGCHIEHLSNEISLEFLDELTEDGRLKAQSDTVGKQNPTVSRSTLELQPSTTIELADGELVLLESISKKTQVFCPFHYDHRASAFVNRTGKGAYLYCSTCQKTWWDNSKLLRNHDFQQFDRMLHRIHQGSERGNPPSPQGLAQFFEEDIFDVKNLWICDDRYLDSHQLIRWDDTDGITFVKSPKGSGKTTYLANLIGKTVQKYATLEEYEQNDDPESPGGFYTGKKVLLIGHRQALIGELCRRLQLNCYLDYAQQMGPGGNAQIMRRFGVCLDSLWRVEGIEYDMIVIDESEQVISHFLSDTVGPTRIKLFRIFCDLLQSAKKIVALDADLGWTSFNTVINAKKNTPTGLMGTASNEDSCDVRVILNDHSPQGRCMDLFQNEKHLVSDLKSAILGGKRIFVTSNSKKKIESLTASILEIQEDLDTEISMITITSSNSKKPEVQEFIKSIRSQILNYQVILSSPSLGTGVDISFDNGDQLIDSVYGFFEPRITSHFEIDQQLGRVRNPKETKVWINSQRFQFETEFEIILDDMLRSELADGLQLGFNPEINDVPSRYADFLRMAALVTRNNRASKNQLKENFIAYKKQQNFQINLVDKDERLASDGLSFFRAGQKRYDNEHQQRLLSAKTLNEVELKQLQKVMELGHDTITEAEQYRLRRTFLELFYREKLNETVIKADGRGKLRNRILLMETFRKISDGELDFTSTIPKQDIKGLTRHHIELIPTRTIAAGLLLELVSLTPVFDRGEFQTDVLYSSDDLSEFANASIKLERFVQGQLGISTKKDISDKPIQHLGKLLREIGLSHQVAETKSVDGSKFRFYQLEKALYEFVSKIIGKRKSIDGWKYLNSVYGFEYSAEEVEWLMS